MFQGSRGVRAFVLSAGVAAAGVVALAQPGPVTAMFDGEQKRDASRAASFTLVELPAASGQTASLRVLLGAGDLERAFDRREFRPAAVIIPTNTDLAITAQQPATQRVLISRIEKQPEALRELEGQIAARKKKAATPAAGESGVLRVGVDTFVAQLASGTGNSNGNFPKSACFIATEFAAGGAVDRRELHSQDRLRKGVASCLSALDTAGAQSVVMPQMGASSAEAQTNDAMFEGQRTLRECRLINSVAGIALGIHDFAASRRNLREIGVVQWDQEIAEMFEVPAGSPAAKSADMAYRIYADQILQAFRKGLDGRKTLAGDLNGSCSAVLDPK